MIYRDTSDRFSAMEADLGHRVIGQHDAVRAVAERLRLNKGQLKENHYAQDGVLLFLGPTRVVTTVPAMSVADGISGVERKWVRFGMS